MQNTRNPLIFIIEDSVVFKNLIVGYLQSKKLGNIKTFSSGEECLKELHLNPDLIVLDYSFAGISGFEFMLKVKGDHPDIDFVFLSAQNDVEVAVKIMKLGAADYIVKNEKAPYRLAKSIEQLISVTKKSKIRKGFKIGVVGFFIVLFVIIMVIILMTIFINDFNFNS
ncbi:MAG: response regulator [Prolixibacteraceae bacterium]|nr:response regulator [Prolixibacteraceae bacterium]